MKERPILFNSQMVRALLDGSKTQTRRIVKNVLNNNRLQLKDRQINVIDAINQSPFGQIGDQLWVRETWVKHPDYAHRAVYRADPGSKYDVEKWTPSIHMPKWASRIQLEITGVRVEPLNDISEGDAEHEGCFSLGDCECTAKRQYKELWESINGPGSWDANPWVWVIKVRRVQ